MAKIIIIENFGILPKKPTGIGFHYEMQRIENEGVQFYRRQKIKTNTNRVSSTSYSQSGTNPWGSTIFDLTKLLKFQSRK
jgi:hypothetical protein